MVLLLRLFLFLFALFSSTVSEKPLNVFVYSIRSGYSHSNFMGHIADVLADGGMNVTLLSSILVDDVSDGSSKAHIIHVSADPVAFEEWNSPHDLSAIFRGSSRDLLSLFAQPSVATVFKRQCKHLLHQTAIIEQLTAMKFEVAVTEPFDFCGHGLAHLIGAKTTVTATSTALSDYMSWVIGVPLPLSAVPTSYYSHVDGSLSSRFGNLVSWVANYVASIEAVRRTDEAFREEIDPDFPSVETLMANSSLFVTACEPLADFARPTMRNIVDIGGLGVREPKPLAKEYDDLLSLRPRTVLLSFGSVAKSILMPAEYKRSIAQAFSRFPDVTFIWKYENPEDNDHVKGVSNVILKKWMPQSDLLGDPRVAAIISHGGRTSLNEVAHKGKPVVMIPLFGDQVRNGAIAEHLGFGKSFDKADLDNPNAIEAVVREILTEKSYATAAASVAASTRSRPFSPREELVRNVQFVGRHGLVKSFEYKGSSLPLYIFWNLDLVLIFVSAVFVVTFLSFFILKNLILAVCSSTKKPASKIKAKKH